MGTAFDYHEQLLQQKQIDSLASTCDSWDRIMHTSSAIALNWKIDVTFKKGDEREEKSEKEFRCKFLPIIDTAMLQLKVDPLVKTWFQTVFRLYSHIIFCH